jgi:putative FmdB family regulatory protein
VPIYEYVCQQCRHRFELLSFAAAAPICPRCSAEDPARQLSTFAVSTRGSGSSVPEPEAAGCGSCGDPRGPGACAMDEA